MKDKVLESIVKHFDTNPEEALAALKAWAKVENESDPDAEAVLQRVTDLTRGNNPADNGVLAEFFTGIKTAVAEAIRESRPAEPESEAVMLGRLYPSTPDAVPDSEQDNAHLMAEAAQAWARGARWESADPCPSMDVSAFLEWKKVQEGKK